MTAPTTPTPTPTAEGDRTDDSGGRPSPGAALERSLVELLLSSTTATNITLRLAARLGDPFAQLDVRRPGDDPHALYDRLRARGPLVPSRLGVLLTTSHGVANAVLRATSGSVADNAVGVRPPIGDLVHPVHDSLIALDPPDHTRLRRLVARGFTPSRVAAHRARIEAVAHELLDALPVGEPVDLVGAYFRPLPLAVICDVIGVPQDDRGRFAPWGDALAATLDRVRSRAELRRLTDAIVEVNAYFDGLIASRRADPGEDLVSVLVGRSADDGLDRRELIATLSLLLIAGFETTVNLLGLGTRTLLERPDELALVIDEPDRTSDLVEEALRFCSPVQFTSRRLGTTLTVEVEAGGATVEVPAGSDVVTILAAVNRDPAVFADPHRFDIGRPNAREHLSFASGAHYCLGASLARLEAEVAWRVLFERFPRLRAAGPATPGRSVIVDGLQTLPVVLR